MSTATIDAVESLQVTLEPLGALHGEQSQLEAWVHDSFSALEKLHSELTEWQSELARKQTELDLREDAIRRSEEQVVDGDTAVQLDHWKQELEGSRKDIHDLEEENAEQLQELENMELAMVQMEKQLLTAEKTVTELTQLLEIERARATQEQSQWQGEFKDMRRLLEKQCSLLEDRIRESRVTGEDGENPSAQDADGTASSEAISRAAELRRRAKSRRAARLRRQNEGEAEEPNNS